MANKGKSGVFEGGNRDEDAVKMSVRVLSVMSKYDGGADVEEWLERVNVVCDVQGIKDARRIMPLLLEGPAFSVFMNMPERDRNAKGGIESALRRTFGMSKYVAYEMFANLKCLNDKVDMYAINLKRLAKSAGIESKSVIKCAFVCGLPRTVSNAIKALHNEDSLSLEEVISVAKSMTECASSVQSCAMVRDDTVRIVTCGNCGRQGHASRSCFRNRGGNARKCWICGDERHLANACGERYDARKTRCEEPERNVRGNEQRSSRALADIRVDRQAQIM